MSARAFLAAVSGIALCACESGPTVERVAEPRSSGGAAAFEVVRAVFQHPRCQNCHIPGDAPLQYDAGLAHGQEVQRGPQGHGVPGLMCASCHMNANPPASWGANQPPGAPNWHLPPPETKMVFLGLSSADLARQLKDPRQTGGRDLEALYEHVVHDALVLWGWDPGVGRAPVHVPHAEFVAKFRQWIDAGAPVPGG
jgi:hypothetical protein